MERSLVRAGSESGRKVSEDVIRHYIIHRDRLLRALSCSGTLTGPDLTPLHPRHTPHGTGLSSILPLPIVELAGKMVRDSVYHLSDSLTQIQAVCQYFLRGACKFGGECRNEHPQNGDRRSAFGGKSPVALHSLGSLITL